jgi:hypothetical protein
MTDPQTPTAAPDGEEPVADHTDVDDVVVRAREGLAHAEAVAQSAVSGGSQPDATDAGEAGDPTDATGSSADESSHTTDAGATDADATDANAAGPTTESTSTESDPAVFSTIGTTPTAVYADAQTTAAYVAAQPAPDAEPTEAASTEPAPTAAPADAPLAEPVVAAPAAAVAPDAAAAAAAAAAAVPVAAASAPAPQPIFVQAPEAPRPRGNRGASGAIGLLAALCFAVLLAGARIGVGFLMGTLHASGIESLLTTLATSWTFWTPVIVFFLGFWLFGAFINRGRWGHWVVWGLIVALIAWAGFILGQLVVAPFWTLTPHQVVRVLQTQSLAPMALASFIIARELTVWFGAWAGRRGRKVTERNRSAREEYERQLETGIPSTTF